MNKSLWKEFVRKIPVKASRKALYKAWATEEGITSWFLRECSYTNEKDGLLFPNTPISKGSYHWKWHGHPDNVFEDNKVIESNGIDFFKFGFEGCIVTINIEEQEGFCMVTLTQGEVLFNENPDENLYVQCGYGWTFYLANLKSVYEGGLDLRNKDVSIKGVLNA